MHIYYATRGLRGRPYHSGMINTDLFAFFQGKRMRTIPSAETLRAVNAFPKCDIDMGEDTDSEYACEKGTFYIPKSICMGEVVNAGWAVDYYFVVLCGDAVELRYVRWDCPWYETVGRDTEVTDPAVIAKMERTLAMLLDANKPRIPAPVPISRPACSRSLPCSALPMPKRWRARSTPPPRRRNSAPRSVKNSIWKKPTPAGMLR